MALEDIPPLPIGMPIVDKNGAASREFAQWWQQMFGNTETLEGEVQGKADASTQIIAGTGLTGGGDLSADRTLTADEQAILDEISTTQGAVLYRGASDWAALAPGTSGQFLKTNGAAANPAWAAASAGGTTEATAWMDPSTNSSNFSSGFYGARPVFFPKACTLDGVGIWSRTSSGTPTMTPAIYSATSTGGPSTLVAQGSTVNGISSGYNSLPLSSGYAVSANTVLYVGFILQGGVAINLAASLVVSSHFYAVGSTTPTSSPSWSTTTNTWSSMWAIVS